MTRRIQNDFEHFLWTIVCRCFSLAPPVYCNLAFYPTCLVLAMGGISLGKGVESSGLLSVTDVMIRHLIQDLSLYEVVLVLSTVVLACKYRPVVYVC